MKKTTHQKKVTDGTSRKVGGGVHVGKSCTVREFKVVPPSSGKATQVDWSQSAALSRRARSTILTTDESATILADSQGH